MPNLAVTVPLVSEPARSPLSVPEAAADRSARPRKLGTREPRRRVTRYTCSAIYTRADGEETGVLLLEFIHVTICTQHYVLDSDACFYLMFTYCIKL